MLFRSSNFGQARRRLDKDRKLLAEVAIASAINGCQADIAAAGEAKAVSDGVKWSYDG